ncbi:MAG: DNA cytosine methyltransferase [Coprobacillus sp.]|nr:DNA cytosine methyltransferase [Coprobacillus sp.]
MKNKIVAIDLFSGAGGLSEGFLETNRFDFVAHVEWEKPMVDTLRANLINRWNYDEEAAKKAVIRFDIQKVDELVSGAWTEETKKEYASDNSKEVIEYGIDGLLSGKKVDVIIGGPPCQAYSIAGRYRDSMKDDYRNYLFESFVKVVNHYRPKFFVFENVPGMLSAKPGDRLVVDRIYDAFNSIGYEIRKPKDMKKSIYSAADYEVPQDRHRVIIFGVDKSLGISVEDLYLKLDEEKSNLPRQTVRDAIGMLPKLIPLKDPYKKSNRNFSHSSNPDSSITLHESRYHNKRDIQVFKTWISKNMNSLSNEDKVRYYNEVSGKNSKNNKYRNLEWDKPSPTIVAHLYKDGLMFIHPDIEQLRSITIREAAILQSFPIDYDFVGSMAYCYKMIGNAVPVNFAKHIAQSLIRYMEESK